MFLSPESFIRLEAADSTWERRAPRMEDDHLLAHTQNWLNAMPRGARPVRLQTDFPRIANELSRLWEEPTALDAYFETLEFSPRAYRMGFPPVIKEELLAMHVFSARNRTGSYEQRAPTQASLLSKPLDAPLPLQAI